MISLEKAYERSAFLGKSNLLVAAFDTALKTGSFENKESLKAFEASFPSGVHLEEKQKAFKPSSISINAKMLQAFEKALNEG